VSAASLADPTNATLKAEAQTLFQAIRFEDCSSTLRLLGVRDDRLIAGIASFVLAGVIWC